MTDRIKVTFPGEPQRKPVLLAGRDAWALRELLKAGERGVTPIDNPAPRWSGYVHKLRRQGLDVETVHEAHGGPFPGTHARYLLHTVVEIHELEDAE